jgi:hypothetical protein
MQLTRYFLANAGMARAVRGAAGNMMTTSATSREIDFMTSPERYLLSGYRFV